MSQENLWKLRKIFNEHHILFHLSSLQKEISPQQERTAAHPRFLCPCGLCFLLRYNTENSHRQPASSTLQCHSSLLRNMLDYQGGQTHAKTHQCSQEWGLVSVWAETRYLHINGVYCMLCYICLWTAEPDVLLFYTVTHCACCLPILCAHHKLIWASPFCGLKYQLCHCASIQ